LSESALTTYVREVQAGVSSQQSWDEPTRHIGLFDVRETQILYPHEGSDTTVRLITAKTILTSGGFVYSPKGKPFGWGDDTYYHLDGAWWGWLRDDD
jgi:hypothetical protein